MELRIVDLPRSDRPRERLDRIGVSALSDREIIALLIRTGGRGVNALDVADRVLAKWGSLGALGTARIEDLTRVEELGMAKAASLLAAFELGRRATLVVEPPATISGPADIVGLVRPLVAGKAHEEAVIVVANAANKPIRTASLCSGGTDRCLLTVRDTLAAVLRNDGVAFALAHNHPSGDPTPSREDIEATRKIAAGAAGVGLRFLDHVVIGGSDWTSIREMGVLTE